MDLYGIVAQRANISRDTVKDTMFTSIYSTPPITMNEFITLLERRFTVDLSDIRKELDARIPQ